MPGFIEDARSRLGIAHLSVAQLVFRLWVLVDVPFFTPIVMMSSFERVEAWFVNLVRKIPFLFSWIELVPILWWIYQLLVRLGRVIGIASMMCFGAAVLLATPFIFLDMKDFTKWQWFMPSYKFIMGWASVALNVSTVVATFGHLVLLWLVSHIKFLMNDFILRVLLNVAQLQMSIFIAWSMVLSKARLNAAEWLNISTSSLDYHLAWFTLVVLITWHTVQYLGHRNGALTARKDATSTSQCDPTAPLTGR